MSKRTELLVLMADAGLIDVPKGIRTQTRNIMIQYGATRKDKLKDLLLTKEPRQIRRRPGVGVVTCAELCWWLVYGDESEFTEEEHSYAARHAPWKQW